MLAGTMLVGGGFWLGAADAVGAAACALVA